MPFFQVFQPGGFSMNKKSEKHNFKVQQWKAIIQDRINSGLTVKEYCEQNSIKRDAYFYWLNVIRREAIEQTSASGFVELSISSNTVSCTPVFEKVPVIQQTISDSGLIVSVNGITICVTEKTSAELLARTIGVIRNA